MIYEESVFLNLIYESTNYLKKLNKSYISKKYFNLKINYDLSKFNISKNSKQLTWIIFVDSYNITNLYTFIEQYEAQDNIEKIILDIYYLPSTENDKYSYELEMFFNKNKENIRWLELNIDKDDHLLCQELFENTITEYMTFLEITDTFENNFSEMHIDFLNKIPSCDITTSSYFTINETNNLSFIQYEEGDHFIINLDIKLSNNNRFVWRTSIINFLNINSFPVTDFSIDFFKFLVNNHLNLKCCFSEPLYTINIIL